MNNSTQRTRSTRRFLPFVIRHSSFVILLGIFASSLSAQTPTPTSTPTPHAVSLHSTTTFKGGTGLNAVLRAIDDGHGAYVPAFILVDTNGDPVSLGGGGGGGDASAANQTTEIARLTSILAKIIAAPATEAKQDTGNTSVANVDTNLGAKADSAASTDTGTFSLIALFKRALQTLTTIATNTAAALPAGTNVIGSVGIDQTTPGTTNAVSIDQTTPGTSNAVAITGSEITISIETVSSNGSVGAGKRHIEFILSSDFVGTIDGEVITGAALAVYSPGEAPVGSTFAQLDYEISAGSGTLTTW